MHAVINRIIIPVSGRYLLPALVAAWSYAVNGFPRSQSPRHIVLMQTGEICDACLSLVPEHIEYHTVRVVDMREKVAELPPAIASTCTRPAVAAKLVVHALPCGAGSRESDWSLFADADTLAMQSLYELDSVNQWAASPAHAPSCHQSPERARGPFVPFNSGVMVMQPDVTGGDGGSDGQFARLCRWIQDRWQSYSGEPFCQGDEYFHNVAEYERIIPPVLTLSTRYNWTTGMEKVMGHFAKRPTGRPFIRHYTQGIWRKAMDGRANTAPLLAWRKMALKAKIPIAMPGIKRKHNCRCP